MKKLSKITDEFIDKLKADVRFDGVNICKAYPYKRKGTLLAETVIAVSISNIELSDGAVGDKIKVGSYGVNANLYFNVKTDKDVIEQLFTDVCDCVFDYNLTAVSAEKIYYDRNTDSLLLEALFTYNDEIDFGGDADA